MEFDPRTTPRELVVAWVRMGLLMVPLRYPHRY